MKRTIVILQTCVMLLAAAPCKAGVIVTSEWKRLAFSATNIVSFVNIRVQGDTIGVLSRAWQGSENYQGYRYSTNDGLTWTNAILQAPDLMCRPGSFFLGEDGLPFAVDRNARLFYSQNNKSWLTNQPEYVPTDHVPAHVVAALDPAKTNIHIFYTATNRPPIDPVPGTNVRYAVFEKKKSGPGWDPPATNIILGGWPATNMFHGAYAFRNPADGQFYSVRSHALGNYMEGDDPWFCAVTNGGGVVINMNTPFAKDGNNPHAIAGPDGTCYMVHVGGCIWGAGYGHGTNLIFTEFRYNETSGLAIATNEMIATGPASAHRVTDPCVALGVNGEVVVAYLASPYNQGPCDVRIIARDRFGRWQAPVTVASGDYDTPGNSTPGAGRLSGLWGNGNLHSMDMALVQADKVNYVYLFYGEYRAAIGNPGGDNTANGVVHRVKVYDPPPPKGTIVNFK